MLLFGSGDCDLVPSWWNGLLLLKLVTSALLAGNDSGSANDGGSANGCGLHAGCDFKACPTHLDRFVPRLQVLAETYSDAVSQCWFL